MAPNKRFNNARQHGLSSIETLRDSSPENSPSFHETILKPFTQEFISQITGKRIRYQGEILPGETLEMRNIYSGKQSEVDNLKSQLRLEKRLRSEEMNLVSKRSQELRVQIEAIKNEVSKLARVTPNLSREVEIASFQAPGNVSIYELFFLQNLLSFLKSFRERIEQAHVWLYAVNTRARKKNVWGANYKKYGSKYLLSGEHYLQRASA